jgi:hypothetical protein
MLKWTIAIMVWAGVGYLAILARRDVRKLADASKKMRRPWG